MNLTTIAEHTICLDLLPERANVLDLGCRGFLFANELRRLGHYVYTVDIDPEVKADYICAIGGHDGYCGIVRDRDPQATKAGPGNEIPMYTLVSFSEMVGIEMWQFIKMDIESSEYDVIMSLKKAPSTQIEFEAHLHTGAYGLKEVAEMRDKLESLGYSAASHKMTKQHGLGLNFWSSLFILQ